MNLNRLKARIESLHYVLMRNLDTLPPEGDLDLFVSSEDREMLETACLEELGDRRWFDIRTIGDGYYSSLIEENLLEKNDLYNGWKVPTPEAHFLSLYYHQIIHKGDNRYDKKLRELFWNWVQPPMPTDEGVGFHDYSKN